MRLVAAISPQRAVAATAALLVAASLAACGQSDSPPAASVQGVDKVGGQRAYETTCASCHGAQGRGTDKGPPFVDAIYEPSHHADAAFLIAVQRGVPAHHWSFGDMPPQPGVSDADLANIVGYVRSLQADAGIR